MKHWEKTKTHPRREIFSHTWEKRKIPFERERTSFSEERDQIYCFSSTEIEEEEFWHRKRGWAVLYGSYSRPYCQVQTVHFSVVTENVLWLRNRGGTLLFCQALAQKSRQLFCGTCFKNFAVERGPYSRPYSSIKCWYFPSHLLKFSSVYFSVFASKDLSVKMNFSLYEISPGFTSQRWGFCPGQLALNFYVSHGFLSFFS